MSRKPIQHQFCSNLILIVVKAVRAYFVRTVLDNAHSQACFLRIFAIQLFSLSNVLLSFPVINTLATNDGAEVADLTAAKGLVEVNCALLLFGGR